MDNKELYKNVVDKIHASEELKRKTINKIEEKSHRKSPKVIFIRYMPVCAMLVVAVIFGAYYIWENNTNYYTNRFSKKNSQLTQEINEKDNKNLEADGMAKIDLPTFESIEELRKILKENNYYRATRKGIYATSITEDVMEYTTATSAKDKMEDLQNSIEFSSTNVQVDGVDEADIVKTDGNYIYYTEENNIHIIKADTLEEVCKIDYREVDDLNEYFSPLQLYLVKNKLVVIGNYYTYDNTRTIISGTETALQEDVISISGSKNYAKAIIYDVSNPASPKEDRVVSIDGNYNNSRMIGNNLYFIASKTPYYYDGIKDIDILPCITDSKRDDIVLQADEIIYFRDTNNYSYIIIAGVDITKNEEVSVESFFGSWVDSIYASTNNLYLPIERYFGKDTKSEIYKFSLKDAKVEFVAKGTFEGYLNNQFSMDEYNDYLRIATTNRYGEEQSSAIYIYDKDLKEVSRINNIAKGERIYAVRFMGKIGYVVTFEQIDPLFVVDLADPLNPAIKGELEMPGYSSYLHPYDETHIIGIGYNVKSNGYGGVTNTSKKMAMFDVSDLSKPKEMFSIDIGDEHVYSELDYNHKALLYSKLKNLIGFPFTTYGRKYSNSKNVYALYDIDLEKGFTVHGEIIQNDNYKTNINRAVYIDNALYTISASKIVKYNLETMEEEESLDI